MGMGGEGRAGEAEGGGGGRVEEVGVAKQVESGWRRRTCSTKCGHPESTHHHQTPRAT